MHGAKEHRAARRLTRKPQYSRGGIDDVHVLRLDMQRLTAAGRFLASKCEANSDLGKTGSDGIGIFQHAKVLKFIQS